MGGILFGESDTAADIEGSRNAGTDESPCNGGTDKDRNTDSRTDTDPGTGRDDAYG